MVRQIGDDFPTLTPKSLADYQLENSVVYGRDLATILGFPETEETVVSLTPRKPNPIIQENIESGVTIFTSNQSDGTVLLLFGDSFGDCMPVFLTEHFSKVIYAKYNDGFEYFIDTYHPDIVIWEKVERYYFRMEDRALWKVWSEKVMDLFAN